MCVVLFFVLQAFLACAFRPDRTRKYLYTERWGRGEEDGYASHFLCVAPASSRFSFKKCGVICGFTYCGPGPPSGPLEGVPLLFIFLFAPGRCALQGGDVCGVQPAALQQGGWPAALLVLEGGGAGVVADDLAVGGGRPLHAPTAPVARGADARVAAGGAGAAQHGTFHQVAVEDGSVWGRAHRLPVQLQLLFGVPQLERAGALVGRGLLPVRQRDGGRQVDLVLQVRVGGLEAVEAVPLGEGGHSQAVGGPGRGIHLRLEGKSQVRVPPPSAAGPSRGWGGGVVVLVGVLPMTLLSGECGWGQGAEPGGQCLMPGEPSSVTQWREEQPESFGVAETEGCLLGVGSAQCPGGDHPSCPGGFLREE